MDQQIIAYKSPDGSELPVKTDGETVWLTQRQMCQLFGRDRTVITKHINNIFKEGELVREVVCAKWYVQNLHIPLLMVRSRVKAKFKKSFSTTLTS